MREPSLSTLRSVCSGARLGLGCALVVLLLSVAAASGREPPPGAVPAPGDSEPVFQPFSVQPASFAALTLGGGTAPATGGWQVFDMLLAGEHPWIAAWELYAPPFSPREQTTYGAATLVLLGGSGLSLLTEPALLLGGENAGCWRLINRETVRPIPPRLLAAIRDGRRLISSESKNGLEFEAYLQTIQQAHETSPAAFRRVARSDVAFTNLYHQPAAYRGEVIHLEGRLRLVLRDDAPAMLKLAGIANLYYAWVFDDLSGGNPYCVVITELPSGVPINQKMNQPVTFDGYFYMNRRYKAEDSKKPNEWREAPLLIAPTLSVPVADSVEAPSTTWPKDLLTLTLSLIVAAVALVAGLAYWFRWNDQQVRRRVSATRRFVEPEQTADAVPWSSTPAPAFSEDGGETPDLPPPSF